LFTSPCHWIAYGGHDWDFYGVAWNLKRLLKQAGTIVWVVADKTVEGDETGSSMRQALHFKEIGLRLNDTMIWEKDGFMQPTKGVPRYYQTHEMMYVFSKGKPKFNPIRDIGNKYRDILNKVKENNSAFDGMSGEFKTQEYRKRGNVWRINVGFNKSTKDAIAFDHPATFPEALARDHILTWSDEKDVVLDPFSGSGTTAKVAKLLGRRFIGIEVNPEYIEISKQRLCQGVLF
jgi:DNA modification methylase